LNRTSTRQAVKGRVIARESGAGLGNVGVEAWDHKYPGTKPLGDSTTDDSGRFEIAIETPGTGKRAVFFRVFQGPRLIASTEGGVLWNSANPIGEVAIPITGAMIEDGWRRIAIESLQELKLHEAEILARIADVPNGGNLFLLNPFRALQDVAVILSGELRQELVRRNPGLSAVSTASYDALRNGRQPQSVRVKLSGLFRGGRA
jgi:hypothetical protein